MSNHLRNGTIYLTRRSNGLAVKFVQTTLGVDPDSRFGSITRNAVREFQSTNGLAKDGIVGPVTFTALAHKELKISFSRTRKYLYVQLDGLIRYGIGQIYRCAAISGLPAGHPRTADLIREGRSDLDMKTNYMLPEHDDVSDAGPITDDTYELPLRAGMVYQVNGGGWGVGGWYLDPGPLSRLGYRLGLSRGGFFLHHDGNGEGTGGCIGVSKRSDMVTLRNILTEQQKHFPSSRVKVRVT